MGLREDQSDFARKLGLLLQFIYEQGYEVTLGDAWAFSLWTLVLPLIRPLVNDSQYAALLSRSHKKGSFHYRRLAIDLNLFKDGVYLGGTDDHRIFGEFWESIGGTWGGRFKRKDGNHYSYKEGKKWK